ncbi:MAG: tetratricopeptide repeat protein [Spirochaetales bacterium]|nr:tetratricopeptide repeat protein [Spirochaetales bacterium]
MKSLGALVCFFLLSPLLFAQISSVPAAQLLAEQGLESLENKEYEEALQFFLQARELDENNELLESYIASLSRMVSLENFQADPEEIDRFVEEKEKAREEEEDETLYEEDGETDFITQEQNKEKARQDRTRGELSLSYPPINSSNGSEVDSYLRQSDELLDGFGYQLTFYPEVFNRTIGLDASYGSYATEIEEEVNLFDEAGLGLELRNFFNEQPGSYSLLGTHLWGGFVLVENLSSDSRQLLPLFRFEAFFRDPTFYRLARNGFTRSLALKGKLQFTLLDDTYIIGYGGGLSINLGQKMDITTDFIYRNYLEDDSYYSSWTVFMGMDFIFR